MKRGLWLAAMALGLASAAHAGASQNDAGCGLGAQIFKENRPVDQILAATTNGCIGSQTFGITTGTLGCSSGGLIKASKEREVFTATNFRALEKELAAGQGQYVSSLAAMTGCGKAEFGAFAKTHYEKLLPSEKTTSNELLSNLDKEIAADATMAKACGI